MAAVLLEQLAPYSSEQLKTSSFQEQFTISKPSATTPSRILAPTSVAKW